MLVIKHFVARFVIPVALSAMAFSAHAMEFSKPSDAVDLRQDQMSLIAGYFGDMGAMVKGKKPFNATQFKIDAERLADLASWGHTGYENASYTDSDSSALPAIWKNKAEFDRMMSQFATNAAALKTAAAGGNLKASLPAFKAVAGQCGSCHKKFRD